MSFQTPYTFQVVIDCAAPHVLAQWWAQALHWEVEPQDPDFIGSMLRQGFATEQETTTHRGSLVWATGAAINHPDARAGAPRLLFQLVPEPKTGKNRVHLDLRISAGPSSGSGTGELDRLIALGATEVGRGSQGPHSWVVLTDPEGNELCLPATLAQG